MLSRKEEAGKFAGTPRMSDQLFFKMRKELAVKIYQEFLCKHLIIPSIKVLYFPFSKLNLFSKRSKATDSSEALNKAKDKLRVDNK